MLADRVRSGDLPPLKQRLPGQPLVVEVVNELGTYGGTLRNTAPGPGALSDLHTAMVPGLFRFSADLSEQTPELAESFEFSTDYTACVVNLRPGVRWSDGTPFTADDVIFYFEDWQFDKGLAPVISPWWTPGGERMTVTKLNEYSVEFSLPYPTRRSPWCSTPRRRSSPTLLRISSASTTRSTTRTPRTKPARTAMRTGRISSFTTPPGAGFSRRNVPISHRGSRSATTISVKPWWGAAPWFWHPHRAEQWFFKRE